MSYTDGIGPLQHSLNSVASATPAQQVSATESKAGTAAAANRGIQTDHADLSTTGGLISKALEGSDVRTAKVEALQQAIASGSYNVSSSDVADKMIQSLLE
jgi:negative regulator of flagellin synthesis FlgM